MPIVRESEPLNKVPTQPVYNTTPLPKQYKHSIVESDKTPIDYHITNIEGSSWIVDYYSQVLGENEEPKPFQTTANGPYQQYELVKGYELKLQGELSASFDDAQQRATVTGSALMYPKLIIPNKGDVIIGDIGDGRAGRFNVTSVSTKSIYLNTTYEIEFTLASILDEKTNNKLDDRVVKTHYFNKDFLIYGQNPVLVESEYHLAQQLTDKIDEVLGSWFSEFYSHEVETMIVPNPAKKKIYDPFIVHAMLKVFSTNEHYMFDRISTYNISESYLSNYTDIWSAIIDGKPYMLNSCFKRYQLVSAKSFNRNVMLRSIRYSGIDLVVLPKIDTASLNDPLNILRFDTGDILGTNVYKPQVIIDESKPLPAPTYSVLGQDNYVVSNSVYKLDDKPVSKLEQEIRNYFQGESLDAKSLMKYVDNRHDLTPTDRFYAMPLCLLLMMSALRRI